MKKYLINTIKTHWFRHIRNQEHKSFYRLMGLRRSGNHAVMNWLLGQMEGRISVLDNMQKNAPENVPHKRILIRGWQGSNLLVSHEDRPLEDFFLKYDARLFGQSERRYSILILRDPYNWLASWYAWQDELGVRFREEQEFRNHTIGLWKDYARMFIDWQNNPQPIQGDEHQVPLNYNRWTTDIEYRRELAETLNLKFTDKGREKVSINGYGSSFSGQEFQGQASKMDVLNRWQRFAGDEVFCSYLDEEMVQLAERIFPELTIPPKKLR